tara:strand:- start:166980 stop:168002 length:1023 start_codon:yes stop_codon:yes gene_type:complete
MSLYDTGTVSINSGSNTITGTGTNWVSIAGVKEGDLFTVDGAVFYQIYLINSNEEMLAKTIPDGLPYAGGNLSGVKYAIIRHFTDSTNANIASAIMELQQKWHIRENEMTDWFFSAEITYPITSLTGVINEIITPFGMNSFSDAAQAGLAAANDIEGRMQTAEGSLTTLESIVDTKIATSQGLIDDATTNAGIVLGYKNDVEGWHTTVGNQYTQIGTWYGQIDTWQDNVSDELALTVTAKDAAEAAQEAAELAEANAVEITSGTAQDSQKLGGVNANQFFRIGLLPTTAQVTNLDTELQVLTDAVAINTAKVSSPVSPAEKLAYDNLLLDTSIKFWSFII